VTERQQVVRVDLTPAVAEHYGGTPRWLGLEDAFGSRPLVGRGEADVMDPQAAAKAEWAYRRARAWRGDQVAAEDVE
jgi:hypothetical protein